MWPRDTPLWLVFFCVGNPSGIPRVCWLLFDVFLGVLETLRSSPERALPEVLAKRCVSQSIGSAEIYTLYYILYMIRHIYSIERERKREKKRDLVLLLYARRTWCNIIKMLSCLLIHSMRRKFISIDSQSFPSTFGPGFRPLELLTTHRHGHRDGTCGFFAWSPEDGWSIGGDGF